MGDEHPTLSLATDHPRSAQHIHSAARHTVRLDATLSDAIRQTAQAHESTPFMLLLAAFQSLLHRYSGQRDIRIGVPNANRPRLETQGLIGFFINTQVLRAEVDSRLPFVELLAQTRQAALGAQAHQDLPFEQLLEAFPQAREQGLFQVMFNHQQRDLSALRRLPGLLAEELPWHSREAKFDLQLHSEEDRNGRLSLSFDYASELFDAATIERLAEHFSNLLRADLRTTENRHRRPATADLERARSASSVERRTVHAGQPMAAGIAQRTSAPDPGAHRADVGRRQPGFRRTAHPGQSPGPLPARQRRRPGRLRGHRRRAFAAVADRPAGDHQGRWRLRAAGPGLPGRAPGLHAQRQRRRIAADPNPIARSLAGHRRRQRDRHGRLASGELAEPCAGPAPARRQPGLRDLHLRFHRPAEGRRQHPRGPRRTPAMDAEHLSSERHRRADAKGADQFRRVGVGVLLAADHRMPSAARRPRRTPRSASHRATGSSSTA